MHRREFLKAGVALTFAAEWPTLARADVKFDPTPGTWRSFQVADAARDRQARRHHPGLDPAAVGQSERLDQIGRQPMDHQRQGDAGARSPLRRRDAACRRAASEEAPVVEVTSRIATQDRAVDLTKPGKPAIDLAAAERKFNTAGTGLIPVDGIVKETSDKIIAGKTSEIAKVHAIYEWVVENTFRDAKVRGCGIGDISAMLKTGNLGGKCADLNALFVGLVRAAGIPARDVYGIRVAPSKFGYKALGAGSEVITKAQHCRAEVFLAGYGWVATDPADVRKVVLEEPPANLAIDDPKVAAARKTLFGAWEGNWLAYNFAHDVALPGSNGPKLAFLMYPQGETGNTRLDCLDADNFKYTIKSKELTAT